MWGGSGDGCGVGLRLVSSRYEVGVEWVLGGCGVDLEMGVEWVYGRCEVDVE